MSAPFKYLSQEYDPCLVEITLRASGEVEVLLPAALNNLAKGNLMLVVTVLLPSVGESFPKNKGSDVIQLSLGHAWLVYSCVLPSTDLMRCSGQHFDLFAFVGAVSLT